MNLDDDDVVQLLHNGNILVEKLLPLSSLKKIFPQQISKQGCCVNGWIKV